MVFRRLPSVMVTMKHIAEAAGTSVMTVSRVMRNHPLVSAETRSKVLSVASDLGYQVNPMVSAWMAHVAATRKSSYTPTLYFLSLSPRNKKPRDVQRYIEQIHYQEYARKRAVELGYRLEVLLMDANSTPKINQLLKSRNCPGVLVSPTLLVPTQELALDWDCFSAVTMGYSLKTPNLHRVCLGHYEGMQDILHNIAPSGKKIGFVTQKHSDERVRHLMISSYLGYHYHHPDFDLLEPWMVKTLDRRQFGRWFLKNLPDFLIFHDRILLDWVDSIDPRPPGFRCKMIHLDERFASDPRIYGVLLSRSDQIGREAMEILAKLIQSNERGLPQYPRTVLVPTGFSLRHRKGKPKSCG